MKPSCSLIFVLFLIFAHSAFASDASLRETYAEGRRFMQEGKWTKALEYLQPLGKTYFLLSDYILFDVAACYDKSGFVDEAKDSLRKIISNYKTSPIYRKAYRKLLEIGKVGDVTTALSDYDHYLKEFPQDSAALWDKTDLLVKMGKRDEVSALWKEIFFSGSPYTFKAYEELRKRSYRLSYDDIMRAAQRLTEKEQFGQVVRLLEVVSPQDEDSKYLLGKAYFRLRRYRDVIKTLAGTSLKDGKYLFGLSLLRANEKDAFYRFVGELQGERQKEFFSLHILTAELKRREGNVTEAGAILQSMLDLYPEKKEEIIWSRAWLAIRQKQWPDAENLLSGLMIGNFSQKDKYLFWLGKIRNYQGRSGIPLFSQIKDKNSYYWFKAGNREARPLTGNSLGSSKSDIITHITEDMNRNFQRITELERLKMNAEAREEARLMTDSVTEPLIPAFVPLLTAIEDYATLVRLGTKYNLLPLKYPLAFRDTVLKHAQAYKMDPLLVTAIMREESRFRYDAESSAGARGVMQLMPATARRMGQIKNNAELFEVGKNIQLGTYYLSKLFAQLKSPNYTLAAYNAGEHNVGKWLAADYQDEDEFTEDIPFGETKNYVFKVMQSYGIMKTLYVNEN